MVEAPSDFTEGMREVWRECQEQLRDQDTWVDTDHHALERFVRAVALAKSAREAADAEPFVLGDRGKGLKAHPGYRLARDAELDAQRYAESLLLTPQLRKRHDVKTGKGLADVIDLPDLSA